MAQAQAQRKDMIHAPDSVRRAHSRLRPTTGHRPEGPFLDNIHNRLEPRQLLRSIVPIRRTVLLQSALAVSASARTRMPCIPRKSHAAPSSGHVPPHAVAVGRCLILHFHDHSSRHSRSLTGPAPSSSINPPLI